jgi:hypothetical protein
MAFRPTATTGLILCTVLLVAAGIGVVQHTYAQTSRAPSPPATMKAHSGPLPALPSVPFTPVRPMATLRQVYEFAARHPEVLKYVPCYCGCERVGHNGNHDCFVKSRAANGTVTAWDTHGMGCAICIDVGTDALALFNTGASPSQIRVAIDRKYGSSFPSSTPTPHPAHDTKQH